MGNRILIARVNFVLMMALITPITGCGQKNVSHDENNNKKIAPITQNKNVAQISPNRSVVGTVKYTHGDTIILSQYGAIADGKTDISTVLQSAIDMGGVIKVDKRYIIRHNIYLYGHASLVGVDDGEIVLDGDFAKFDGRKYVFNCGITAKKGENRVWTGFINNLKITGSSNAYFGYCIQLHNVNKVLITNSTFNFKNIPQSNIKGGGSGTAIEGLNDREWNIGSNLRINVTISNNKVLNRQDNNGSEALGIAHASNVVFDNNYCYGMGDDGIAMHNVQNFTISNNKLYLVDGRIFISNSRNGKVFNNYIERIPMQIQNKWANSESFIRVGLEEKKNVRENNNNISIFNNIIKIPESYSPLNKFRKTYVIRILGAENCSIKGNTIIIDCDSNLVNSPISIENAVRKMEPKSAKMIGKQILKPKQITVQDNVIKGRNPKKISIEMNRSF